MTSPYRTIAQWLIDKESVCNAEDVEHEFDPWVRKSPWRRKWQPTSVFLPGKFHGWRSLAGYSPWGRKGAKHDSMSKPPPLYVIYYFSMLKQGRDPS